MKYDHPQRKMRSFTSHSLNQAIGINGSAFA